LLLLLWLLLLLLLLWLSTYQKISFGLASHVHHVVYKF
jgi:hypothetical protein